MRVESAVRLDLREPLARERSRERTMDEPHALLELRFLVLGGSLERPLEDPRQRALDELDPLDYPRLLVLAPGFERALEVVEDR